MVFYCWFISKLKHFFSVLSILYIYSLIISEKHGDLHAHIKRMRFTLDYLYSRSFREALTFTCDPLQSLFLGLSLSKPCFPFASSNLRATLLPLLRSSLQLPSPHSNLRPTLLLSARSSLQGWPPSARGWAEAVVACHGTTSATVGRKARKIKGCTPGEQRLRSASKQRLFIYAHSTWTSNKYSMFGFN